MEGEGFKDGKIKQVLERTSITILVASIWKLGLNLLPPGAFPICCG